MTINGKIVITTIVAATFAGSSALYAQTTTPSKPEGAGMMMQGQHGGMMNMMGQMSQMMDTCNKMMQDTPMGHQPEKHKDRKAPEKKS